MGQPDLTNTVGILMVAREDVKLYGVCYVRIIRDSRGVVSSLGRLDPRYVTVRKDVNDNVIGVTDTRSPIPATYGADEVIVIGV